MGFVEDEHDRLALRLDRIPASRVSARSKRLDGCRQLQPQFLFGHPDVRMPQLVQNCLKQRTAGGEVRIRQVDADERLSQLGQQLLAQLRLSDSRRRGQDGNSLSAESAKQKSIQNVLNGRKSNKKVSIGCGRERTPFQLEKRFVHRSGVHDVGAGETDRECRRSVQLSHRTGVTSILRIIVTNKQLVRIGRSGVRVGSNAETVEGEQTVRIPDETQRGPLVATP